MRSARLLRGKLRGLRRRGQSSPPPEQAKEAARHVKKVKVLTRGTSPVLAKGSLAPGLRVGARNNVGGARGAGWVRGRGRFTSPRTPKVNERPFQDEGS
ncbi:hypothetical protein BHE74_00042838 [Ensete ventricosum]|nr:hypothetical protein BHE74_00042838 [Ensete ventricosum]